LKLIARIVVIILLVLTALVSGFALLCELGVVQQAHINEFTETLYNSLGTIGAVAITAGIFVVLVLVLVALLKPESKSKRASHVLSSYDGSIKITHAAITDLIKSLAKKHEEIFRVRVNTKEKTEGLYVLVVMILRRNANIIQISQTVKKETEDFLVEQCGVKVSEVEVLLERVIGRI